MASRVYFYKDEKGITQKYEYCSLCAKGPFTQEEQDKKYKVLGGKHSSIYCMECARNNRFCGLDIFTPINDTPSVKIPPSDPVIEPAYFVEPGPIVDTIPEIKPQPAVTVEPKPKTPEVVESPEKIEPIADRQKYGAILIQELNRKKPIPIKGPYATYIAQCSDGSYVCGVTRDIVKESVSLNNGGKYKDDKLPIEIIYYRTDKELDRAKLVRDLISKYKRGQKERLISIFEKQLFGAS